MNQAGTLPVCVLVLAVCLAPTYLCRRIPPGELEVSLGPDGSIKSIKNPGSYPPDIVKISREEFEDFEEEFEETQQHTTDPQPTRFPPSPRGGGGELPIVSDTDHMIKPGDLKSSKSPNPLVDQKNLSVGKKSIKDTDVIQGSRNAFTITKIEYLRKERCKTERLLQVIRMDGCRKRTIMNKFCYGQCNSFFIPKSGAKGKGAAAFQSCSFCKPRRTAWVTVTLICPRKGSRPPRVRRKKVQMIKSCKCMAQRFS